jgi:hypothetical protein
LTRGWKEVKRYVGGSRDEIWGRERERGSLGRLVGKKKKSLLMALGKRKRMNVAARGGGGDGEISGGGFDGEGVRRG